MKAKTVSTQRSRDRSGSMWQTIAIVMVMILVPWALYVNFHPRFASTSISPEGSPVQSSLSSAMEENSLVGKPQEEKRRYKQPNKNISLSLENYEVRKEDSEIEKMESRKGIKMMKDLKKKKVKQYDDDEKPKDKEAKKVLKNDIEIKKEKSKYVVLPDSIKNVESVSVTKPELALKTVESTSKQYIPVLGPVVKNGIKPLYGKRHTGGDAIFALACKYPKEYYQRFVGSVRQAGFTGDVVLAVSPPSQMHPGVENYIKKVDVVAYGFEVDCLGKDNCKLKDDFLGYPDPRPHRTFANIRYALYEYWLSYYTTQSYVLILDFRDTFFQASPFKDLPPLEKRPKLVYDLWLYAENHKVKTIGSCVYNSLWIGRCFGPEALVDLKEKAVICSGSTMGSEPGIKHYIRTMLASMDKVQCWRKGIESDQGYQSYLFYNGHFHTPLGNATLFHQGEGVVNTIGAMNGFRVPKDKKGPLDTFWKIRDKEGYILNNDGSRSYCVHQWDRFYAEIAGWLDTTLYTKIK